MSPNINELINSPTKASEKAQGVLARLFREIMKDVNMTHQQFNKLMMNYLNDPSNGFANDSKKKSSERSNLIKEMARPTMTWKVFRKCIKFLSPIRMRLSVELTWSKGATTYHYIDMEVRKETYQDIAHGEDENTGEAAPTLRKAKQGEFNAPVTPESIRRKLTRFSTETPHHDE